MLELHSKVGIRREGFPVAAVDAEGSRKRVTV